MKIRARSVCVRRTRSSLRTRPLLSLPEEVILLVLKFLPATDLTNLRLTCSGFKTLIDSSSSLWMTVSFPGIWPSTKNLAILERAANVGNIEALIKIGLAHLYNEGITEDRNNNANNAQENGRCAANLFCKAERSLGNSDPFIWFFVRPPWAPSGVCCKACVFKNMVEFCSNSEPNDGLNKSLLYCIGKITSLHVDEKKKQESIQWLQKATDLGSSHAAFEIWKMRSIERSLEPSLMLQSVRELRDIASSGNQEAQLSLAMQYAAGNLGGATKTQVIEFLTQFVSRSKAMNAHKLFSFQTELNSTMRCILLDWLVEVALMKDFSSQVVHIAVHCVDQFIIRRKVQRSELQLLGITCILIAARFHGKDIVTIREAAWLTDNTYKYEEVVRMMGEVMSCVRGQVRVLTIPDFLSLFSSLAAVDRTTECLASYVADLSILHTEFGRFSPSVIAASSLLLASAIQQIDLPWPLHMPQMTGLKMTELLECTFCLHQKCLLDDSPIDHRNVKLKAIKERYSDERFMKVSELKVPSREQLRGLLVPLSLRLERHRLKHLSVVNSSLTVSSPHQDSLLDTSINCLSESGYEGDLEDEDDIMLDDAMGDDDMGDNDERFYSEFQSLDEQGMLNRQLRDSSFLASEEYARSTSTPSILRQNQDKAFFEGPLVPMDMEIEPVAIDNTIDSAREVFVPVARQPLKNIENDSKLSERPEQLKQKSNQRRKECPLKTRKSREANTHRLDI